MRRTAHLPYDLVQEIIVKLPVKSLVRFKSVCKTWLDLISDRRFIRLHAGLARKKIFLVHQPGAACSVSIGYQHKDRKVEPSLDFEHLDFDFTEAPIYNHAVVHCDGLFCLASRNHPLVVWNLTSKEFRKIEPHSSSYHRDNPYALGFGYDHVVDDYKIVRFPSRPRPEDSSPVGILALKSGFWRDVDLGPRRWTLLSSEAISSNGKLYWFASRKNKAWRVLCFDLAKEEFADLPVPPCFRGSSNRCMRAFRDGLCLMEHNLTKKHIDVWVLKEDQTSNVAWEKLMTASLADVPEASTAPMLPGVMTFNDDDEILVSFCVQDEERFFVYDACAKKFRRISANGYVGGFPRSYDFVQGLVRIR